jgi:hypothetical protein
VSVFTITASSACFWPFSERFVRLSYLPHPTKEPRLHTILFPPATLDPSIKSMQIVTNNTSADGMRTKLTFAALDSRPGVLGLKPQVLQLVMELLSLDSDGKDVMLAWTSASCPQSCREREITFRQFVTAGSRAVLQHIQHCHQGRNYFRRTR